MNLQQEILNKLLEAMQSGEYFNPYFLVAILDMLGPEAFNYYDDETLESLYTWAQEMISR